MVFWTLQILFNLLLSAGLVVLILRVRKQETLLRILQHRWADRSAADAALPVAIPQLNTPLGSPTSTLSERVAPEHRAGGSAPIDAYDKADFLISRGVNLREVARQTGLSLAELQLIGKMSQKSQ
jgi:hypothetical protein